MAGPRPRPRWPAFRTEPVAERLGLWPHIAAILLAILVAIVLGAGLFAVGLLVDHMDPLAINPVGLFGFLLLYSPILSWAGHLPGAFVLHILLRKGWAGWVSVALAGLGIGAVLAPLVGSSAPVVFAPILALFHAKALRWVLVRLQGSV